MPSLRRIGENARDVDTSLAISVADTFCLTIPTVIISAFLTCRGPHYYEPPPLPKMNSPPYGLLLCQHDFLFAHRNYSCSRYISDEKMMEARHAASCLTTIEKCYKNRYNEFTPLFLKECQKCVELLNEGCDCATYRVNCRIYKPHQYKTPETRNKCCTYCLGFFELDTNRPWYFCDSPRCPNDFIFYERNKLCCAQHFSEDKFTKNIKERSCLTDSAGCVGRDTYGSWKHEKRCIECTKMLGGACDCFGDQTHCREKRATTRKVEQTKTEVCCKYCLQNFNVTRDYVCSDIVCLCERAYEFQDLCKYCTKSSLDMKCNPTNPHRPTLPEINQTSIVKAVSYLKPDRRIQFFIVNRRQTISGICHCELYHFGHMIAKCNDLCTLFRMALRWWMNIVMRRSWKPSWRPSRAVATLDTDSKEPSNASNSTASSISICLRLSIAHREQPSFQKCVDTCHDLFSRSRNSYSTMFNHSCKTERGISQAFCSWCWYNLVSDHGAEPSKYHRTNYSSETTQLYVLILHSTHAFLTLLLFAAFCAKSNYSVICLSFLKALIIFLCILSIGYAYGRFVFGPEHCLQMVEGFALSMGTIVAVLWLGEELEGGTRITRTAAVLA